MDTRSKLQLSSNIIYLVSGVERRCNKIPSYLNSNAPYP